MSITRPEMLREIYQGYLDAGSDINETNTFNSTSVSMADYETESLVSELNKAAAKLARQIADDTTSDNPDKTRFVASVLSPTSRTCSISPDVKDPDAQRGF